MSLSHTPPKVILVEARFYEEISNELAEGAIAVLSDAHAVVERVSVPGALEIPGAIRRLWKHADGFVALGCVIRGETSHYEIVANESARGLLRLTLDPGMAIGNGILTCETWEQAMARAKRSEMDKGGGAATACLAMIELHRRYPRYSA